VSSVPSVVAPLNKPDRIALDNRMLQEFGIIMGGEIGPVVGTAAFLARPRRPRHERSDDVKVSRFVATLGLRMRHAGRNHVQVLDCSFHSQPGPYDADVLPHQILNFRDRLLGGGIDGSIGGSSLLLARFMQNMT